jgi:hypothetical protein
VRIHLASVAVGGALAVLAPALAQATPRVLPMSYTADTLPEGHLELEPIVDFTPVKARDITTGEIVNYGASSLQLEIEYGITDRLELGLYITTALNAPQFTDTPRMPVGNGLKQRLRYRLNEPGSWPVDVALYGEVSENDHEIELEAKVILSVPLGAGFRFVTNLWAERELYFDGPDEWVLNPTAALAWRLTPQIQPGIEYWMRAELQDGFEGDRGFNLGPHSYVGPTLMVDFGKLWFTTGVYLRVSDFDHDMEPGDSYGKVWGRMILGLSL